MKIKAVTEAGEKTKDAHSLHLDIISHVTKSTEFQMIPSRVTCSGVSFELGLSRDALGSLALVQTIQIQCT